MGLTSHQDNVSLDIECPQCKKSTTMILLNPIEIDEKNYFEKKALQNTNDLVLPEMTNIGYKIIKENGRDEIIDDSFSCEIVKFGKHEVGGMFSDYCATSESTLKVYLYYFVDHEKKLGGFTFRIIEHMKEVQENGQTKYYSDSIMKKANDLIGKGIELRKLEKYDDAISLYDEALAILPESEKAFPYSSKGVALRRLTKYDDALTCYGKALVINPTDSEILFNMGVLLNDMEKYDDALTCFEQSIHSNPNLYHAWNAKGEILRKIGEPDKAEQCFAKAKELGYVE